MNSILNIRNLLLTAAACLAAALLALPSGAYALEGSVSVSAGGHRFAEGSGKLTMTVQISNTTPVEMTLAGVQPLDSSAIVSASAAGGLTIPPSSTVPVSITAGLSGSGSEPGRLLFYFNYPDGSGLKVTTAECSDFSIARESSDPSLYSTAGDELDDDDYYEVIYEDDSEFKLRLSSVDPCGAWVPTPEGDYGDEVLVRLPITCVKDSVYDIKVTPVLSENVEKFPFDIDLVDYTLSYPGTIMKGETIEFKYNWRLSKKATVGVKKVDFNVTYRDGFMNSTLRSGTVSVFVNVQKGLSQTDKEPTASIPKLIVESYAISSDKIYAGQTFDVEFTLRNTSSSESVQNVQIRVKDAAETATVVPASGGSNTIYIDRIGKGETATKKLSFQTAPDAAAKAYTLNLDFSYESASTNTPHTAAESIAVPILQQIRLKCDEPVIYDEMGWLGQSCSMYVKMYNMGRSTIYNCIVSVEGDGLEMEETYFGGNLNGGSTLSADFSVIPSVAGDIAGEVVISYEDVYGEPGEERLPFDLYVEDMSAMEDPMMSEDMVVTIEEEPEGGIPVWVYIAGGGVLLASAAVILVRTLRRRRRRSLEDDY